jgi:hypothetical protein
MKAIKILFLLSTISLLTVPLCTLVQAVDDCASCHGGTSTNGNYDYVQPAVSLEIPGALQPNATFDIILTVNHPGTYELKYFETTLDLSGSPDITLSAGETAKKTLGNMDNRKQSHGLIWHANDGTTEGIKTIGVNLSYTVYYHHNSGGSKDTSSYSKKLTQTLQVMSMPFNITPSALHATVSIPQSYTINITALTDLYNIEIIPSLSLTNFTKVSTAKVNALPKDHNSSFQLSMTPDRAMEHGSLVVLWSLDKAGNNKSSMSVPVIVADKPVTPTGEDPQVANQRLAARVLGFIGLIILILLLPTGGALSAVSRRLNPLLGGAKKRVDLHCALSYLLLAIALLHSSLLMYGHYYGVVWKGIFLIAKSEYLNINLGTTALCLMLVISLLGILQKRLVKVLGRKAWGYVHGIISYVALALIVVHLIWIGTTAAPVRALLGL